MLPTMLLLKVCLTQNVRNQIWNYATSAISNDESVFKSNMQHAKYVNNHFQTIALAEGLLLNSVQNKL